MAEYHRADIRNGQVVIDRAHTIDKKTALSRLRKGDSVYTTKSRAHTLAQALSEGNTAQWKDNAHVVGGYRHYHDATHQFAGHIFFGEPH